MVVSRAKEILNTVSDPSRALQRVNLLLQNFRTTTNILKGLRPVGGDLLAANKAPNVALICGAPVEHPTVHVAMQMRTENQVKARQKELGKAETLRKKEERAAIAARKKQDANQPNLWRTRNESRRRV